jgi:dual specificity tyrosine-phosphorylation-regulated kinase 2/3/4
MQDPHNSMHVIHIVDSFEFRGHLCICFELLSHNLYEFMRFQDFRGLNMQLVQKFAAQLVHALCFLKQEAIIHCDLKPENILLQNSQYSAIKVIPVQCSSIIAKFTWTATLNNCSFQVIDFGSSCYRNKCMYTYIQSRFYRSPEVILGMRYGHEIDMWSLGCLLCELAVGKALFQGENERHQLALYTEALGHPPAHIMKNLGHLSKLSGRVQVSS